MKLITLVVMVIVVTIPVSAIGIGVTINVPEPLPVVAADPMRVQSSDYTGLYKLQPAEGVW